MDLLSSTYQSIRFNLKVMKSVVLLTASSIGYSVPQKESIKLKVLHHIILIPDLFNLLWLLKEMVYTPPPLPRYSVGFHSCSLGEECSRVVYQEPMSKQPAMTWQVLLP